MKLCDLYPMSFLLAIAVTIIVIIGVAMILYVKSKHLLYAKGKCHGTIATTRKGKMPLSHTLKNTLYIKNPQNNPINIIYVRILDDKYYVLKY